MPDVQMDESPEQSAASDPIMRGLSKTGRSSEKRQRMVLSLHKKLKYETRRGPDGRIVGPLQPCTLVNFNPVPLLLEIEGRRITIPAAGTSEHHRITIPYSGRKFVGQYLTIANPIIYTTVTGHEVDSLLPIDVPTSEARYFSPHAVGTAFWHDYTISKMMGGLLMFDQDKHALSAVNLEKMGERIWVPRRTQIEDSADFSYDLRETSLEDELESIFQAQQLYADVQIQSAHTLWMEQDGASQKMVTDTHRDWARYVKKMAWGLIDGLPEWVTAKISATGPIVDLKLCQYCGKQQTSPGLQFCQQCNAPYDAFKAFMAKLAVPQQYLELLTGEELDTVLQVQAERRARFAVEEKPAKGKGGKTNDTGA